MSPIRLRQLAIVTVAAAMLALAACGGSGDAETTPLPLQSNGLAIGGDPQAGATNVTRVSVTKEQAKAIIEACDGVAEIPSAGEDKCTKAMAMLASLPQGCESPGWCATLFTVSDRPDFAGKGIVEITDSRQTGSLCGADPRQVCMRVGITTQAVLDRVLRSAPAESPSSTTATTSTPESTSGSGESGTSAPATVTQSP